MSYTEEQLKYINFTKRKHTKLLACAGSGKTRCIIARMNYLIEDNICEADEILMLTFSRFTRDDFMTKIKSYGGNLISQNSVKTIDSFAKHIIDPDNTVDVSLLSFRLMEYLGSEKKSVLKKHNILKKIKMVFIDEAQDLNEIQFNIFQHMKIRLGIIVNMIGDPNQNIYQFRNSSDKYLTQFEGIVFKLTKNFRSHECIVDFSKYLRPFSEYDIQCAKGANNCKPIMMFYEDEKILEDYVIDILKAAQKENIDLSEFAILSPTRGRMRGAGRSHGLCFISNILYKARIKFKQFYEESVNEVAGEGIKYEPTEGHVNVLTYMGSKGLEWNYVILIDADSCLINKRCFNEDKHKHDQYLLYVACSRAVENMYIFSNCYFRNGQPHFKTNPWFKTIPPKIYDMDTRFVEYFFYPELRYIDFSEKDTSIPRIIDKLDCYDLDEITKILDYQNKQVVFKHKIFDQDYTTREKPSAIFLSRYTQALFHALYNIKHKKPHVTYEDIESIVDTDEVITGASEDVIRWYYHNRKHMNWKRFDTDGKISKEIKDFINSYFDRSKDFNAHTIAVNGYYQWFILKQKTWIKNLYHKYLKCNNTTQIRDILFYLMVVMHSINTQHYFHIKSRGKKYYHVLRDFKDLFDEIEEYVDTLEYHFINTGEPVSRWGLTTSVDMIDSTDKIWTLKCASEISLKNVLNNIICFLMYESDSVDDNFVFCQSSDGCSEKTNQGLIGIDCNYINFLKGEEIGYRFELTSDQAKSIMDIIYKNTGKNGKDKINQINESNNDHINIQTDDKIKAKGIPKTKTMTKKRAIKKNNSNNPG